VSQLDLTGKIAVVTGAGGGLGSAICAGLARHGADVTLVVEVDASNEEAGRDAFARVDPVALTLGAWELAIKVNLTSYFLCCRAGGERMIGRGAAGRS
jgi:NAD(P)-dependent dehydrogenase (short-subunit alcohol dehydrogenase family)